MFAKKTILLIMSFVFVGPVAMAQADTEADTEADAEADVETIVKYRHGVMTSLKGHLGASARIVFEGYEVPEGHLAAHAAAMAAVTNDIPALFPEGSTNDESEALSSVWEQPERFAEAARTNHSAAQAFAQAVNDDAESQELSARFEELIDSCGGCHDDFREEHDH